MSQLYASEVYQMFCNTRHIYILYLSSTVLSVSDHGLYARHTLLQSDDVSVLNLMKCITGEPLTQNGASY